jgi:gliding motility-associated-like protein
MKKLRSACWLLFLLFLPVIVTAQIPTNGLVACYLFNGNANDESGNNNNGTVYGPTLTYDRCSNPNSAFNFNGDFQYISLPPGNFLLNEYTYAGWIKVSSFPAEGDDGWMIFSPGSSSTGMCQGFSIHTLGEICGISYNIGNNPHGSWAVTPPIQTGKWFHIAYTRSYSILKIYINGVLMPYRHTDIYSPYPNNQKANYGDSDYSALIGCRSNFKYDDYFQGDIDDLYIYNRPLSNDEILELCKSTCVVGTIEGLLEVCAGQENVAYTYPAAPGYTNYNWTYSGDHVNIVNNSNSIVVNFSDSATSGKLTLLATGKDVQSINTEISIIVDKLPSEAGIISGENDHEVCQNSGDILFTVPEINSADSYIWDYSGSGTSILGNSNSARLYFLNDATSGNLTVYGTNECGAGAVSEKYPIIVKSCTENPGSLHIPNAFSPNGDGINDVFVIQGLTSQSQLLVFDRSGKKCYQSDNYLNDWDGRDAEGEILPSDTYWYVLIVPGIQDEYKGFVYLKK